MQTIEATINGSSERLPAGLTVARLLERLKLRPERVAVEKNGVILPKAAYEETMLETGDRLEIVSFVGGG